MPKGCPTCSQKFSAKSALESAVAALQKKAKKDAEHLKTKKATESRLKECEVAMIAVKDAMKDAMKAECSKLNLAEKESSWRGLHSPLPPRRGLN